MAGQDPAAPHRLGNLNFPKGKIKKRETAEQAAIREVLEETGLVAEVVAPLGTLDLSHIPKPQIVEMFLMRGVEETAEWPKHVATDTEPTAPDRIGDRLTFREYREFWRAAEPRVRELASTD